MIVTKLDIFEAKKRLDRLNTLIVLVEGYDDGEGKSIYDKALRAYEKYDNFTGVIRLSNSEKDWLSYLLECDMISEKERKVIKYYTNGERG